MTADLEDHPRKYLPASPAPGTCERPSNRKARARPARHEDHARPPGFKLRILQACCNPCRRHNHEAGVALRSASTPSLDRSRTRNATPIQLQIRAAPTSSRLLADCQGALNSVRVGAPRAPEQNEVSDASPFLKAPSLDRPQWV